MRTETYSVDIYTFDELSDDAKENALESFRCSGALLGWQEENADTVKQIAETFGWRWRWDSYDGVCYDVSYDLDDADVADLSGVRAWAYIENNYISRAEQPVTYWKDHVIYCDGRKNWTRKSKIWRTIDNCPFTGYCMDCCFSSAWREWKEKFTLNSTVEDFVEMVADHLSHDWTADNEYQMSDEYIIDLIQANGYEFTDDGKQY